VCYVLPNVLQGGIVMTNDGNCILREVDVSHPAAKSMIELSRAQDEEVGDGTTSVIILSTYTHSRSHSYSHSYSSALVTSV
jgi:T-complex protein 1 subunit gamma